MPELPEVETTVRDLKKEILKRIFFTFWTDSPKMVKKFDSISQFKKELYKRKIENVWRRGKNILFQLSGNKTLLIHQKISGHLLLGKWKREKGSWVSSGALADRVNSFIHLIFIFDNDQMLALSDPRKFAKVELWDTDKFLQSEFLQKLGPEPLEENFTLGKFKQIIKNKKGKIKQVLMNQEIIAGIGNIYSDEILFKAKINPLRKANELKEKELKQIYLAIKTILKQAIKLKGDSFSDYRTITGEKGRFQEKNEVYKKDGQKCPRCQKIIKKIKIGGRSAHYCSHCQR
ncbi:MAG: bifunctional DNA-formamidopyrimidine glycosylase/DNA-(apurinic or apyrimidinic site) lyase [Patescibacteria group bacterium]|nr:bifunctional DNA-formamidopyrimidine glycosylase/DNA-(apurinic or apyrimidinic site) lyase [Patescibacteria group bacterium]MBU1876737.1 bifunctional DNA-formamidopyrimidine glycosylase/DNA-(apurinic or apyrimidinic site) lyase [Patescibacteria group bacterium]